MFYTIKNDKLWDFADFKYSDDCLETDICTTNECAKNPEKYIVSDGMLIINPDWNDIQIQKRKENFYRDFFNTSLGWIRRKVTMKDGSVKDFLADLLLPIKAGIELRQEVEIITYKNPDFNIEPTVEYMESLQERKFANSEFIQDCLIQIVQDFGI